MHTITKIFMEINKINIIYSIHPKKDDGRHYCFQVRLELVFGVRFSVMKPFKEI